MGREQEYAVTSEELLLKAGQHLAHGDLLQGSEKGWGAAAQMVKAVAERRGWPHNGHRQPFELVRRLVEETGDQGIRELFLTANALHTNSYEVWLTREDGELGLDRVRQLLERLRPLLS
jgi:hypothetical protein